MDHEAFPKSVEYLDIDSRICLWDATFNDHPRFRTYQWWFNWIRIIENHQQLTKRLLPVDDKTPTHIFDALLGTMRPHKNVILNFIKSHPDPSAFLLGTTKSLNLNLQSVPNDWILGGDFETRTNKKITYVDQCTAQSSCFVPYAIYNRTWYSLICETRGQGPVIFTEKLGKALLAQRIFILVSSHHALKSLRRLGFRTFSHVLDESYDEISDDHQRWTAAWKSVKILLDMDPKTVYKSCQDILYHNQQLILTTDWDQIFQKQVTEILTSSE